MDDIAYAGTTGAADAEASSNDAVTKFDKQNLTEITGSNQQAFYINATGVTGPTGFIRPWIAPFDIPQSGTLDPSHGYVAELRDGSDAIVPPDTGVWMVDYYAGVVLFGEDDHPDDGPALGNMDRSI